MSESTLNRPSEAPDDSEKQKRLIELLVYIRNLLNSEINEIENKKTELQTKFDEELQALEREKNEKEKNLEREKNEKEKNLEREKNEKKENLERIQKMIDKVIEKTINGEQMKNLDVVIEMTKIEFNIHDSTYNTSKIAEPQEENEK